MSLKKEQGFAHLLALMLGLSGLLVISSILPISRHYNDGKSNVAGVYLAKGGDDSGSFGGSDSGSHDSGGSSSGSSSSGSSGSGSSGGSSGSTSQSTPQPVKIETKEVKNEVKNELRSSANKEIEIKEVEKTSRVETKTTPEKIKQEIRQGNLRIKFEIENGKVKIETKVKEAENEVELEQEAESEAVKEVEKELEKEDVKIATAPGQVALVNKRVGALSNLPISVDPTTRQLTVTTPAGIKVVAVLPQKAIDNMLTSKVIDDVVGEKAESNLASIPNLVKLEVENGVLGYKVKGTKLHKLLGFIPIKTEAEGFVSAENGQVVETQESLLGKILNRLAP